MYEKEEGILKRARVNEAQCRAKRIIFSATHKIFHEAIPV